MSTGVFSVDLLRRSIRAQVIGPTDAGYDEARAVWNGSIDRRPLAVVRPADTAEVAEAVAAIRAGGADLTVRGGGHNYAGHAVADGAVMLDLSKLDSVLVDPVRMRARCGGGATWAELDGTANRHGLAVTGGFISDTGIGGLTLGGGFGWLTPLFGMSCDNLVAAEVVTADGHVVAASLQENPDLFWALRGGGGNFGITTSFEFALHEFGPLVQVALLWWPPSEAVGPLVEGNAVLMDLPVRHCGTINAISGPPAPFVPERWQGEPGFVIGIAGDGSPDDLAAAVAPLRALTPTPAWELVAEMPYAALQQLFDDIAPWGTFAYEKSLYLDRIDAAVAEVMVEQYPRKNSPLSVMPSMPLCGRFCDVPEGNTAFGGSRDPGLLVNISASCPDPAVFAAEREWVREFWGELRPFARGDGGYVNFLTDPGQEQVATSYGPKYHRLRSVKTAWDPANVFRHNANITPVVP
ncbi:FAD-binding oxidoreductase [Nocardia sp. NPDC051833]|uniref:FAD-binding oxidoreductase n=1 Tax=Nocardia sp. NPDC051833 TaxID=3155674 RepID=UPI00341290AD